MERRLGRALPVMLATVLALEGCGTGKFVTLKLEQLGRVGVVSAPCANVHLGAAPIPGARAGAARGAKVGALAMVDTSGEIVKGVGGDGRAILAALAVALVITALAPVGAGVGAVVGAIGAETAEHVATADSTLRATFPRLDPAQAITRQLVEVIRERSLPAFVMV